MYKYTEVRELCLGNKEFLAKGKNSVCLIVNHEDQNSVHVPSCRASITMVGGTL